MYGWTNKQPLITKSGSVFCQSVCLSVCSVSFERLLAFCLCCFVSAGTPAPCQVQAGRNCVLQPAIKPNKQLNSSKQASEHEVAASFGLFNLRCLRGEFPREGAGPSSQKEGGSCLPLSFALRSIQQNEEKVK